MAAAFFDRCRAAMADAPDSPDLESGAVDGPGLAGAVDPADLAPTAVSISSAGLLPGGFESPPEVLQALAELDIDITGHRSTQVSPELVSSADLVVCMARRHAREVVLLDAAAFPRTFTLKDLVHRGDLGGPRAVGEPLVTWTDRVHHGRQRTDLVGDSEADDVPDPLGGELDDFRATARELGVLVERLAGLLWAGRRVGSEPG